MNDKPRLRVSSGSPFERIVGFSRAVRIGNVIAIGSTAPSVQTARRSEAAMPPRKRDAASKSRAALEELGASLDDVIRTRFLLTRIEDWQAVAKVTARSSRRYGL
jgi:enamine deaminase RidA (YjgF/YER057c/UK114 family)